MPSSTQQATHQTQQTQQAGPGRDRWAALALLCSSALMVILDGSVLNVALPSVQRDLGFSPAGLAWVANSYLVAFGGLLLLAGRLGDLVGRRQVFIAGLLVFSAASLACGLAWSPEVLVIARFVQGVGGALASAVALVMIVRLFPEPREQATAIGVFTFTGAGGAAVGTLVGGVLTQVLSWHWVFLVNVPIGLVAAALSVRLLARDRGLGLRAGADALGAVLVTAGLMLTVATIVRTADVGWLSLRTLAWGTVAVLLLAGFVVRQATAARPLIRLGLFRSRTVSGANLTQLVLVAGYFGFQFLGALYLQRVLGYDPLRTGLAFLPVPIVIGAMSLGVAGRLVSRIGGRAVLLPALAVSFVGFLLLARTPVDAVYPVDLLPPLILLGIGAGLALPALAITGMSGIDPDEAGLASGVLNTTQQVGGALGLAVLATLAAGRTGDLLATGSDQAHASAGGYRLVFLAGAALSVVSGVIVALLLRPAKR